MALGLGSGGIPSGAPRALTGAAPIAHAGRRDGTPVQGTLDDLGTPLAEVTFVVVDLETTGGSAAASSITEVGAVKVRGGEVLGEFQTLVRPGESIPVFIQVLTGITDAMVSQAPRIDSVLPAFLEFARGSVLVAHNAGFDVSFLKETARATGHPWPGFRVLDTVHLARQLVTKDESGNHKLSSLAVVFGATTTPDHRALHDARATVDVLHGLLERVGNLGVHTFEELSSYTSRVTPAQRRKRFLAEHLPPLPGVYVFQDERGRPLYVGTSRNIRARARSYFTASEQRTRMSEMVGLAARIQPIVCQTTLEGAGARAAPHREAQTALQPSLYAPRARDLGQADAGVLPPPLHRARGPPRRRPLCRAVPVPPQRRGGRGRRPRGRPAPPVHPAAVPSGQQQRVRAR